MTAIGTPRFDIYRTIHKALRACMTDALVAVGRMDPQDDAERAETLSRVREMLAFCRVHLAKEEAFLHPAMEARAPGSSRRTAGEHVDHLHAFSALEAALLEVENATGSAREVAAVALYRSLALFVGENFTHMHAEESENTEVLWRTHCDAELLALERTIVASLSPSEKELSAKWMLPMLSPAERMEMLADMRSSLPAGIFAGVLAKLKPQLSDANWRKLAAALVVPDLAA